MEIDVQAFDTSEVAADGHAISLGIADTKGERTTVRLLLPQVGALLMSLPGLIDRALQNRFGDRSLRYAYPMASWVLEQSSDPARNLVTLRTLDGFSVCFSISGGQQSELAQAFACQPELLRPMRAN